MFEDIIIEKEDKRTENTILKKSIINYLKTYDKDYIEWYKTWGNGVEKRGRPDLQILYMSQTWYFELKDPKGDLDTVQQAVIKKYKRIGIPVYVVDNIGDFKKLFPISGLKQKKF